MTGAPNASTAPALDGRWLAVDSATDACSVALFENGELIAGELRMLGRGHAEALVPMIASLPGRGRADRIAVSLGPGSFTGVRVGLAAARALAFAWNAELVGYCSLALIAAMARRETGPCPVAVAITGGHGEWFAQEFEAGGTPASSPVSLPPETAAAAIPQHVVAGNQAEALVSRRGFGQAIVAWPDARQMPLLPQSALLQDIRPIYGRGPDAKPQAATTPVADAR